MGYFFRKPGPFRIAYWIIMLSALAVLLWYIHVQVGQYNQLMK